LRTPCSLLIILILCACIVLTVSAADGDPVTTTTTEPPVTLQPVTAPTTEPTTAPPTTEPTTNPTTEPTQPPTTEPTVTIPTVVTTEPTITITIPPTQVGGGKGYIDVYSNVNGASVYFNGNYEGQISAGVLSVGVSPTGSPVTTILVSKAGYNSWTGAPSHMPADGEHVAVNANLQPITTVTTTPPQPTTGTIYAQSSPSGAAIYLNGNFYGYSPVTIPNLVAGSYSMKASLSGYTPDTRVVTVAAGQTTTYYPTLQPSPPPPRSTGTVSVTSNPTGALVYADNNYQGKAPVTVTLYPGSHTFRLTLTGYSDYVTTVYVNAGSSQSINAVMPPGSFGTVKVLSLPGAMVSMDSAQQGTVPSSGTLTLNNVGGGNHLFKVTASGYNDWMNTVYIQPNVVTSINAALTPVGPSPTPVPASGSIQIATTPDGAEIFVDNLFKGYSPATLTGIAAGQHTVLLKYTGYIDSTQSVIVGSGQTTPLTVTMQPAPAPTPASPLSPVAILGGLALAVVAGAALRRRT